MGKRKSSNSQEEKIELKRVKKDEPKEQQQQKHKGEKRVKYAKESRSSQSSAPSKTPPPPTDSNCNLWKKGLRLTVSLLPGTLGRTQQCIEDSIRMMLLKHSEVVGGIMLAFENVTIEMDPHGQGRGCILNELPYIHYTVTCDSLVFTPKIGSRLTGVVVETFPSHIGILVHRYFNAMISSDHLRACGYSFDSELHNWVGNNNNMDGKSGAICNDDIVNFQVEKIHECEGAVSLEGVNPLLNLLVESD